MRSDQKTNATPIDPSQTLRLVQSPLKPALTLATAIVLTVVCVGMALGLFPQTGAHSLFADILPQIAPAASGGPAPLSVRQQLYWTLGAVLFAIGAIAVWKNSFGDKRPVLTLSPEGFHFNTVSERPIPWSAVKGVHNWRQQRNQVLIVKLTDEAWLQSGFTPEALGARAGNKVQGVDGVAISPAGLPMNFRQLADAFHAYQTRYGKAYRQVE